MENNFIVVVIGLILCLYFALAIARSIAGLIAHLADAAFRVGLTVLSVGAVTIFMVFLLAAGSLSSTLT